ncbi:MAG: hypothetical protein LKE54_07400 [Prevotella sp.]|jgi:hypothetical protein|nr:hypothetical protein [Prevotella sp.]MCH3994859.1 hypothetical protein [Prevotella sp.]
MPSITYDSNKDLLTGQMILLLNGLVVAFAKSAKITFTTATVDTTNKFDGDFGSAIAGKRSYTVETESLLTEKTEAESYHALMKAIIAGTPLPFVFGTMSYTKNADGTISDPVIDTSHPSYKGNVILTSLEITSEAGNVATNTLQATGSGPLTPVDATAPAGGTTGE